MEHPFFEKYLTYRAARAEFARFVITEKPKLLEKFKTKDRDKLLYDWYNFHVTAPKDIGKEPIINRFSSTMQIFAGRGRTGRYDPKGNWISESGLSLVYSFGYTGHVAVILYPFKSTDNNWKPKEDNILLAVVPSKEINLSRRIDKDLKALVAYGHVTALDGTPTFREKALITWLRFYCGTNVESKWQNAKKIDILFKALSSAGSGSFAGLFKFGWPIILAYILVKCG